MRCSGTLRVHNVKPPFPRAVRGKFHILLAHLRQLHLTSHLILSSPSKTASTSKTRNPNETSIAKQHDVYFVDQLSTCVPLLRLFAGRRVVFYCHFPDKLLANGEFSEDVGKMRMRGGLLKRVYRMPMDWVEEVTTRELFALSLIIAVFVVGHGRVSTLLWVEELLMFCCV